MKNTIITAIFLFPVLLNCKQHTYQCEMADNPEFKNNTAFVSFEDLTIPKFDSLKTRYQPDTVFHGEKDELQRILLLRDWISNVIRIDDYGNSYPGDGSAEGILDEALEGQGFHCGHFMVVQNAVMNAYGYVTRCLGSGAGVKGGPDYHHGINEIWLNNYNKWFMSDAEYNYHFEKNGIPLSALEIRDEYLKNRAKDVELVTGADCRPVEYVEIPGVNGTLSKLGKTELAQLNTWLEWDRSNDRYSKWPDFNSKLVMYRDDFFRNNTWYWGGKPHWAYNTGHVVYVDSRDAIEWTPNTIQGDVTIEGDRARIKLSSITPNFREYQMKVLSSDKWIICDSVINLPLHKKMETIVFRTVNLADVPGPEFKVAIKSR